MSRIEPNQVVDADTGDSDWKVLCRIGGVAALMQFVGTLTIIIVVSTLGSEPSTANEYFTLFQNDRLVGLLRSDFSSLFIIALYLFTFFDNSCN